MNIHELTATALLEHLSRREISAVEAVDACAARIEALDDRVGAFCLRRFDAARGEARRVDAARAAGEPLGPLAGLPMSIKDNVDVAGLDSTLGLRNRQGKPAAQDAVLTAGLRAAGAIFVGKTNVPQLLLAQETENALFGVTRNPWNLERTPGGSSGGEAAALATGMVPAGIGTDIGGSIRIPSHFTGVAGIKPSMDRWSNRGSQGAIPGQELVRAQIGPMARSVADLTLLLRAVDIGEMARHDPRVAPWPIPDPAGVDLRGLRVGYYEDDGFLAPTAAIVRAARAARAALEAAGATVVPFVPPNAAELLYVWLAGVSGDGGKTIADVLGGEVAIEQLKPSRRLAGLPRPVRATAALLMRRMGEPRVARLLDALGEKSVQAVWDLTARRTELVRADLDAWNEAGLDAVICPPHSVPALSHRESGDFVLSLSYMMRYSLTTFPAGIVPVTTVTRDDVGAADRGSDRVERKQASIDAASVGLPVGAQVVARPFREEVALAVMAAVEAGVRDAEGYPSTPIGPR